MQSDKNGHLPTHNMAAMMYLEKGYQTLKFQSSSVFSCSQVIHRRHRYTNIFFFILHGSSSKLLYAALGNSQEILTVRCPGPKREYILSLIYAEHKRKEVATPESTWKWEMTPVAV